MGKHGLTTVFLENPRKVESSLQLFAGQNCKIDTLNRSNSMQMETEHYISHHYTPGQNVPRFPIIFAKCTAQAKCSQYVPLRRPENL